MKHPKDWLVVSVLYWIFMFFLAVGCWWSWHAGEKYFLDADRPIQLIDGWSYMNGYKGFYTEKWKGEFIDVQSGKHFEDELSPQMYQQFLRDGRKPIETVRSFPVYRFDEDMIDKHRNFAIARLIFTLLIAAIVLRPLW